MKVVLFILGLVLAGFLAYSYVPRMAQVIENNVTEDVTAKLVPNDLPADVQIQVDGRDVKLSGAVNSEMQRDDYVQMAQSVEGVRHVDNQLNVEEEVAQTVDVNDVIVFQDQMDESEMMAESSSGDEESPFDVLFEEDMFEEATPAEVDADISDVANDVGEVTQEFAENTVEVAEEGGNAAQDSVEEVKEETAEAVQEMIEEPVIEAEPQISSGSESVDMSEPENDALEEVQEDIAEVEEKEIVSDEGEEGRTTQECRDEILALVEGKRVNFETGQSKIKRDSLELLDSVSEEMRGCHDIALHIHGHTDNVGDEELNRKLSHARAKSVGLYILSKGIKQRIKVFGHGPDMPIASNDNEEGRMSNRRIEFNVVDVDQSVANDNENTVKTIKSIRSIKRRALIAE